MNRSFTLSRRSPAADMLTIVVAVFAAVSLPQLFHAVGALSGTGTAIGSALLPMHLPVLLAGFVAGPVVGTVVGILSPLISFGLSGMPAAGLLPFMILELGVYGFVSGMLSGTRLHTFVQLLLAQIAGRAARAGAVLTAIYLFGNTTLTIASIPAFITAGLFGILLQWALIPLLTERIKRNEKHHE